MRLLWILVAITLGLIVGAVLGFGAALVAMSLGPSRADGTYGMREMLVCIPIGAVIGMAVGLYLAVR